jgi:hypothetical protein
MFIYYIIYKAWNLISFGLTQMKYRAAFTLSLFTALNFYVILRLLGIDLKLTGNYYIVIFLLIWVIIHLIIFGNEKFHNRLIHKYERKATTIKIVYVISTLVYVSISIYLITFK